MNTVTYPIDMTGWRVLRRYEEHWREVKEGDELTARRAYEGHSKRSGGDMVCLVHPSGKVEESSVGGVA